MARLIEITIKKALDGFYALPQAKGAYPFTKDFNLHLEIGDISQGTPDWEIWYHQFTIESMLTPTHIDTGGWDNIDTASYIPALVERPGEYQWQWSLLVPETLSHVIALVQPYPQQNVLNAHRRFQIMPVYVPSGTLLSDWHWHDCAPKEDEDEVMAEYYT